MTASDYSGIELRFSDVLVSVLSTGTRVVFSDGREVCGEPHDTDSYRQTAQRYGYGDDTLSLCIDHEIMHVALSHWLGLPESPTMAAVKLGSDRDMHLRGLEEAAVLAVQQYARAAGVDLIEHFS